MLRTNKRCTGKQAPDCEAVTTARAWEPHDQVGVMIFSIAGIGEFGLLGRAALPVVPEGAASRNMLDAYSTFLCNVPESMAGFLRLRISNGFAPKG